MRIQNQYVFVPREAIRTFWDLATHPVVAERLHQLGVYSNRAAEASMAVFADHQNEKRVCLEPRGFIVTPVFPGGAFISDGWQQMLRVTQEDTGLTCLSPVISAHAHPNMRTQKYPERGREMRFSGQDLDINFIDYMMVSRCDKERGCLSGMGTAILVQADNMPREELVVRALMLQISAGLTVQAVREYIDEIRKSGGLRNYEEVGFRSCRSQLSKIEEGGFSLQVSSGEPAALLLQPNRWFLQGYLDNISDVLEAAELFHDKKTEATARQILRGIKSGQNVTIPQEMIDAHCDLTGEIEQQLYQKMVQKGCYQLEAALFRLGLRGDIIKELETEINLYATEGICRPDFSVMINGKLYQFWSLQRNAVLRKITRAGIADMIWQGESAFPDGREKGFLAAILGKRGRDSVEFTLVSREFSPRLFRFLPREAVR